MIITETLSAFYVGLDFILLLDSVTKRCTVSPNIAVSHWVLACLVSDSPQVMTEDGHASTIKDKILTIDVRPGWKPGTKITFEKEGDQVTTRWDF